jgi:hypothetical protein
VFTGSKRGFTDFEAASGQGRAQPSTWRFARNLTNGIEHIVEGATLEQVADRSSLPRSSAHARTILAGQHDDLGPAALLLERPGCLDPGHGTHPHIHQDHVWVSVGDSGRYFGAVAALPDQLEVVDGVYQFGKGAAKEAVIINDQHPSHEPSAALQTAWVRGLPSGLEEYLSSRNRET